MNKNIRRLTFTVMFAAINFVAFAYGKISIPIVGGTNTAIHIANAIVVLSSWILGPVYGGLAGGIGLSIADLADPRYIASAPKTFIMKFLIAFIAGTVAKKMHLKEQDDKKKIMHITIISAFCGLAFNVIVDPIFGFLYKKYLLKMTIEAASILMTWTVSVTFINAVACLIIACLLYQGLHASIRKVDI